MRARPVTPNQHTRKSSNQPLFFSLTSRIRPSGLDTSPPLSPRAVLCPLTSPAMFPITQSACSSTSWFDESSRRTRAGTGLWRSKTCVCSVVPAAMLVSAHSASTCTPGEWTRQAWTDECTRRGPQIEGSMAYRRHVPFLPWPARSTVQLLGKGLGNACTLPPFRRWHGYGGII